MRSQICCSQFSFLVFLVFEGEINQNQCNTYEYGLSVLISKRSASQLLYEVLLLVLFFDIFNLLQLNLYTVLQAFLTKKASVYLKTTHQYFRNQHDLHPFGVCQVNIGKYVLTNFAFQLVFLLLSACKWESCGQFQKDIRETIIAEANKGLSSTKFVCTDLIPV